MSTAQVPLTFSHCPFQLESPLDGTQCPHKADECKTLIQKKKGKENDIKMKGLRKVRTTTHRFAILDNHYKYYDWDWLTIICIFFP